VVLQLQEALAVSCSGPSPQVLSQSHNTQLFSISLNTSLLEGKLRHRVSGLLLPAAVVLRALAHRGGKQCYVDSGLMQCVYVKQVIRVSFPDPDPNRVSDVLGMFIIGSLQVPWCL
jgi:hypothetical protein